MQNVKNSVSNINVRFRIRRTLWLPICLLTSITLPQVKFHKNVSELPQLAQGRTTLKPIQRFQGIRHKCALRDVARLCLFGRLKKRTVDAIGTGALGASLEREEKRKEKKPEGIRHESPDVFIYSMEQILEDVLFPPDEITDVIAEAWWIVPLLDMNEFRFCFCNF